MPLGIVGAGPGGLRRMATAGPGLINGPTVLRSGAMSTEVALRHGDGRIRVTFQHAPAWKQDREQGVGLPDALGLYRIVVRREALRPRAPTKGNEKAAAEAAKADGVAGAEPADPLNPNKGLVGPPVFWRGVPPFKWAEEGEVYSGHSHKWVPGEGLTSEPKRLEEPDERWHERFQVEGVWHLRLGAILIQCPTRIFANLDEVSQEVRRYHGRAQRHTREKKVKNDSSTSHLSPATSIRRWLGIRFILSRMDTSSGWRGCRKRGS